MTYDTRPEDLLLQTRADRLTLLPENVLSPSVSRRARNGVRVDIELAIEVDGR